MSDHDLGRRIIITDFDFPKANTLAGVVLQKNMDRLQKAGVAQTNPHNEVSVFDIPLEYLSQARVLIAGSPAGHDQTGKQLRLGSSASSIKFKQEAFYAMCWQANLKGKKGAAVFMTFSKSACGRLAWWTEAELLDGYTLMVLDAWFPSYMPSKGLADSLETLSNEADTVVGVYAPIEVLPHFVYRTGKLDVAATIAIIMKLGDGILLTLAAYTADLECDIVCQHAS